MMRTTLARSVAAALVTGALFVPEFALRSAEAQTVPAFQSAPALQPDGPQPANGSESPGTGTDVSKVLQAAIALPVATALGAALALRPRRRGTPKRSAPIVQTQIILAVIGALVMLVVGSSLARAFGVVGAAGLVRYRAKIQDPKDAGVMLSTLAVGLAAGVELYFVSLFATVFILGVLWVIESFQPQASKYFLLKIATKQARSSQPTLEAVLRRQHAGFELRTSSEDELSYEIRLPTRRGTDRITKNLLQIEGVTAVDWDEEKKKQAEEID